MATNKEELIKEYMTFRKIECKNKDAIKNYERYIRRFLDQTKGDVDEAYLTRHIEKISNDFSQKTLNNIKPLLKNFIKWKYIDYPTRFPSLDKLCKTKRAPSSYLANDMLTESEITKIIESENDLFWKVFWLVFFYGGFRGIDTVRLKWDNITFENDGMTIIKAYIGKSKKIFYKSIPAEVTPLIKKWRDVNLSEHVFPSPRGNYPIHPKTPNERLTRVSRRALGKAVNPYLLRHSLATIKYNEEGQNDDEVANQMGHSKSMKETYVHLDEEKLIKRAKRVWTDKNEMPAEKKAELERKIDGMKEQEDATKKELQRFKKREGVFVSDLKTMAEKQKQDEARITKMMEKLNAIMESVKQTEIAKT